MTTNHGGRKKFPANQEYRLLGLAGTIEKKVYTIVPNDPTDKFVRADRKGHVTIKEKDNTRTIKVHFGRILPISADNSASVIESGDKYRAICPKCCNVFDVKPDSQSITCQDHGEFKLYWLGEKPVTTKTDDANVATEKEPKAEKKTKQAVEVDLNQIAATKGCELWTKNTSFDHPDVDTKAHVLLFTGDNPRKYCFNTYNGSLGRGGKKLHIEEFLADKEVEGAKQTRPWYKVKDVDSARAKLEKDDYKKV